MADLDAAKRAAAQSGRLVLVHFWTPDCKPCAALEQDVFSQPQVVVEMEQAYVPVKINALELRSTADALGVTRVPTDVVLTPDGRVIDRSISPNSPMAYIGHLTKVASNHKTGTATAFDAAVANAPYKVPNEAYAQLNIPSSGPNAASASAPVTPANAPSPAPSAVANPYAAAPTTASVPPATVEAPSVATAAGPASAGIPHANANPAVGDRYAINNSVTTTTTMNPYASAAALQGPAPAVETPQTQTSPALAGAPVAGGESEACSNCASCDAKTASTPAAAQPTQTVALPTLPPGSAPLGFDGFCPVTMKRQWQWAQGDIRYGAEHRGRTYLFVNQACQQEFLANPDAYSPVLSGMDPVLHLEQAQSVPGKRQYALEYKGQFYLFSNEQTLNRFWQNADQYTAGVQQAMNSGQGRMVR
jgi:YHS domain-containing protein/thiol-disulfide isomerase/thioredoxin